MFVFDLFEKKKQDRAAGRFVGGTSQDARVKNALDNAYRAVPAAKSPEEAALGYIDIQNSLNQKQDQVLDQQTKTNQQQTKQINDLVNDMRRKEKDFRDLNAQIASMPNVTPQQAAKMAQDIEAAHSSDKGEPVDVSNVVAKQTAAQPAKTVAAPGPGASVSQLANYQQAKDQGAATAKAPAPTPQAVTAPQAAPEPNTSKALGQMTSQLATPGRVVSPAQQLAQYQEPAGTATWAANQPTVEPKPTTGAGKVKDLGTARQQKASSLLSLVGDPKVVNLRETIESTPFNNQVAQDNLQKFVNAYVANHDTVDVESPGSVRPIIIKRKQIRGVMNILTNMPDSENKKTLVLNLFSNPAYLLQFIHEYLTNKGENVPPVSNNPVQGELEEGNVVPMTQDQSVLQAYNDVLEILKASKTKQPDIVTMMRQDWASRYKQRFQISTAPDGTYYMLDKTTNQRHRLPDPRTFPMEEDAWHNGQSSWSSEHDQWAKESVEQQYSVTGNALHQSDLQVGDPIIVKGENEYKGKPGRLSEFSPSGRFVIVDLYNYGMHSMNLADIEYDAKTAKTDPKDDYWNENTVDETIRKLGNQYRLYSGKGKNLGTFPTRAGAEKHEREVQYFKHAGESVEESTQSKEWTVSINGKPWKTYPSEAQADKAADTIEKKYGKKTAVTSAVIQTSQAYNDGRADKWYHRQPRNNFEKGTKDYQDYIDGYSGKSFSKPGVTEGFTDTLKSIWRGLKGQVVDIVANAVGLPDNQRREVFVQAGNEFSNEVIKLLANHPARDKLIPMVREIGGYMAKARTVEELKSSMDKAGLFLADVESGKFNPPSGVAKTLPSYRDKQDVAEAVPTIRGTPKTQPSANYTGEDLVRDANALFTAGGFKLADKEVEPRVDNPKKINTTYYWRKKIKGLTPDQGQVQQLMIEIYNYAPKRTYWAINDWANDGAQVTPDLAQKLWRRMEKTIKDSIDTAEQENYWYSMIGNGKVPKDLEEAGNPAQQAAIAIAMKKAGKKPKQVDEAGDRVDPILIKALNRMPDGLASHREVLDAAYDAYAMELGRMEMKSNYGVTNAYIPQLMGLYKDKHGLTFNESDDGDWVDDPNTHAQVNRSGFNKLTPQSYADKIDFIDRQLADPRQQQNWPEFKQRRLDLVFAAQRAGIVKEQDVTEIKKGQKDSNGVTRCWSGYEASGTKQGKNGPVRNCVKKEGVAEEYKGNIKDTELKNVDPANHNQGEGEFVKNQLHTMKRVITHLDNAIGRGEDLPDWVQSEIAQAVDKIVGVMNYSISSKEQDIEKHTGNNALMKEGANLTNLTPDEIKGIGMMIQNGHDIPTIIRIFDNKPTAQQITAIATANMQQGVAEAETDFFKRRERERKVNAGQPVTRQPKNPQTDYARKRAKEKRDLEQFGESTNYWTRLQNERNTKIASLVSELTESVKDIK